MPGGRGGRRNGRVGTAYGNRSDLNGGPRPITTAPGQEYGQAKAQADAQRAVPMGTPDVPTPPQFNGSLPPGMPAPGSLGDLFADSERPDEHVMNGAASGPGLGPEAFGLAPQQQTQAQWQAMARWLPALEQIANGVGGSATTRQFVRQIKANISMIPGQG